MTSLRYCCAALVVGLLLMIFVLAVTSRYLSKIVGGICNALLATLLCILLWRIGFGTSLSNIIIGAIMPLIPGVPFVNGVRDLANSDYLAGFTRLTDGQFELSSHTGWTAVKIAIAIVLGIILAMELPQRLFSHKRMTH